MTSDFNGDQEYGFKYVVDYLWCSRILLRCCCCERLQHIAEDLSLAGRLGNVLAESGRNLGGTWELQTAISKGFGPNGPLAHSQRHPVKLSE